MANEVLVIYARCTAAVFLIYFILISENGLFNIFSICFKYHESQTNKQTNNNRHNLQRVFGTCSKSTLVKILETIYFATSNFEVISSLKAYNQTPDEEKKFGKKTFTNIANIYTSVEIPFRQSCYNHHKSCSDKKWLLYVLQRASLSISHYNGRMEKLQIMPANTTNTNEL